MPATTPRRDNMAVKNGFSFPDLLSSFLPAHANIRIIRSIWTPMPIYLAYAFLPDSFSELFVFFSGFGLGTLSFFSTHIAFTCE